MVGCGPSSGILPRPRGLSRRRRRWETTCEPDPLLTAPSLDKRSALIVGRRDESHPRRSRPAPRLPSCILYTNFRPNAKKTASPSRDSLVLRQGVLERDAHVPVVLPLVATHYVAAGIRRLVRPHRGKEEGHVLGLRQRTMHNRPRTTRRQVCHVQTYHAVHIGLRKVPAYRFHRDADDRPWISAAFRKAAAGVGHGAPCAGQAVCGRRVPTQNIIHRIGCPRQTIALHLMGAASRRREGGVMAGVGSWPASRRRSMRRRISRTRISCRRCC